MRLFLGWTYWLASGHAPQPLTAPLYYAACGGEMKFAGMSFLPLSLDDGARALSYFDSR